jgi:nucleotidyltransferase substrate binding protein (TIGR01987 family)
MLQLEQSLRYYHSDIVQADPGLVLQLRAAAIQAFELTYELSWKMLKRYLKLSEANPAEIETMSFPDLIRTGCDKGLLLSDLKEWSRYRQERGITSHTYDHAKAQEIFECIPDFLKDAKYLLEQLQARID